MHSLLVAAVYFAMVLSPCCVAQWGDLLSAGWVLAVVRRRRSHPEEPLLLTLRRERRARALAMEAAFSLPAVSGPVAPPAFAAPNIRSLLLFPISAEDALIFAEGQRRVRARLEQLSFRGKRSLPAEPVCAALAAPAVDIPRQQATTLLRHSLTQHMIYARFRGVADTIPATNAVTTAQTVHPSGGSGRDTAETPMSLLAAALPLPSDTGAHGLPVHAAA